METPRSSGSSAADSVSRFSVDADEEKAPAAPDSAAFLLHVAQEIRRGFHTSLSQVVSDIGHQYGITSASLAQLETGELAHDAYSDNQAIPADVRLVIQELQSSRQKERELRALVDALEAEKKLTKERLALHSVLSLKLKRELINERLAHIDSKKEVVEARAKRTQQGPSDEGPTATRQSSQDAHSTVEDDPWSSPGKAPGSGATAGSNLLSFTSFYHSSRAMGEGSESEPPSPMSSISSGLQPLRSSLMGQFLPSSLLDSPQLTPSNSSSSRSAFGKNDIDASPLSFEADIKDGLDAFTLSEPPCTQCKQNPVSECTPCGHRLCTSCEAKMLARHDDLECPRCKAKVSSVKDIRNGPLEVDNQMDHFLEGDAAASSAAGRQSGSSSPVAVSPITLSLLAELFDSIPVEQLEAALIESAGQAALAIEKILHTHPSFNPGSTSGSGSPSAPGTKAPLPRSTSANAASSQDRGGAGSAGGGQLSSASSNWKTEMCMYYLQGKCNKTRRTCSFAHGESDLMRTSTAPKHTPSAAFKSRMCPLYLEGLCPKPRRDCPLAHGESDLRDGLAAGMPPSASLPAAAPRLQSYKTELCYYYLKGCCNYTKDECRFAHGEGDLRTVESNTMEWTQKLGGGGADYPSGPGSVSSVASAPSGGGPPGLNLDKQLQHQHQYQQQFQPQQQQLQQPPQQSPQMAPSHQQQQLQHRNSAFPPPPHQLTGGLPLPHQFSPYQPHQQQHMPPPHLPLHHHQQPTMYHGNSPGQFRYLKSMEDAAKQRGARPPPQPRSSWSGYEGSSGGDF